MSFEVKFKDYTEESFEEMKNNIKNENSLLIVNNTYMLIRDTKIFEKTQIQWFDINTLAKRRNEFRSFYKNNRDLSHQ